MAEQEACAELVRSAESAEGGAGAAEDSADAGERGESLLLPLLQGLLDGDSAGGGERLLAGLGAGDADVVADVRRALRRLRSVLTDTATERHPRRDALLALVDRLEDGLDASADRLDGCKRQLRTPRRRSRNFRHTVGVTREELEVARRLVDESDLDDLKVKSDSQTTLPKSSAPTKTPEKQEAKDAVSYETGINGKQARSPITHSFSYDSSPLVSEGIVRRSEPYAYNKDKNLRHSIANGVPDIPRTYRESPKQFHHEQQDQHPQSQQQYQLQPQPYQSKQQQYQTQQQQYQSQQQQYQSQQQQYHPPQPQIRRPFKNFQQRQLPGPTKENIQTHLSMEVPEINGEQIHEGEQKNEMNSRPRLLTTSVSTTLKDNIFRRAPLYRPPPPGFNFASVSPTENSARQLSRFNNNKRNRMKRANTIDIPKPLNFYRVESDTEDEGSRGNRNSIEAPTVPAFQPKTDNDHKFLAFIKKNNVQANIPFSPAKAAASQGQNWNSCFGNIKNTFESQSQSQDRSRSSSSSSARNFWRAADDQSLNLIKSANYGPRLSRKSIQDLQQMHATKATANHQPWQSTNGDVVSASLTVTGPNHANDIIQAPTKPFITKPIPVNQFSHAPMSAFKPPKKVASPIGAPPHVWSPPSYERNVSSERERLALQTLAINDTYVPSKPLIKSPTSVPWLASHSDGPKRAISIAASKFENLRTQPSVPCNDTAPPSFKPKTFVSFEGQKQPQQAYQNYPVKHIPSQNNLAAPQLVKKYNNFKQNYEYPLQAVQIPPSIDTQKLQIEFYEKQILDRANCKSEKNRHVNKLIEPKLPQNNPQVYTVTNYMPAQVTTFMPLQQTPDIEKAKAHKVDYLPDVVLNERNQYSNELVQSPNIPKADSMTKPSYPPARGLRNGTNSLATPPGFSQDDSSPALYDSTLSPGEYDPTEYTTVTRVMRGPAPQQATIKSGIMTRNDQAFKGTAAAKSLKSVLEKFSSPKQEVISQIERKKADNRAPNGPTGGFQVPSPQLQMQSKGMDNRNMYNQPVNMYRNHNAPSTQPKDPKPLAKSVPIIKYNNVTACSRTARTPVDTNYESKVHGGYRASGEFVQSTETVNISSKPTSPAIGNFNAWSPHNHCSTPPSPSANTLSKSESWHQIVERQSANSPRASPRKVVSRAKSMHLLSVPKMFEGGIAQDQLSEKRRTVEAYFAGHASPHSLSKSNSQQTISGGSSPASGAQSPRTKHSISRTKTSQKHSFSLGRSQTMPTINDMKFLDESNADDAFENLLKETFS